MRVDKIHEPSTRIDVTNLPTERLTRTLRRHSDPIASLRIMNLDDDGRNEEESPDNANKSQALAHAASVDDTADVEPHNPDGEPEDDTTENNNKDFNEPGMRISSAQGEVRVGVVFGKCDVVVISLPLF